MEGWIKLHRRFMEWEWYRDHNMVILWIHLLLSANWDEKKWHGITIGRGQILCTLASLAEQTGLSVQQIRTCLSNMQSTGEINKQTTNKYTLLTICNFDRYQVVDDDEQQAVQQTINTQPNKQITTPKESKKKEYNISVLNAPAYTREDWRYISSVRQSLLGFDKDRIAEYKKNLFRAEVEELAGKVGMIPEQVEAFVSWWTEHSPGSEKIKADYETTFDTENRMRIWADRHKPSQKQQQAPKSRMEQMEDNFKFINDFFDGLQQQHTAPDEQ